MDTYQIWFQNRRQNDRRKSRPLTPQEIAALRCGGIQIISELSLPKTSLHPENPYSPAPSVGAVVNASSHASPALSQEADSPHFHGHRAGSDVNESPVMDSEVKPEDIPRVGAQTPSPPSASTSPAISQSFPGAGGFLSNRWNPLSSFSTPSALAGGASDDAVKYVIGMLTLFFSPGRPCTDVVPSTGSTLSHRRRAPRLGPTATYFPDHRESACPSLLKEKPRSSPTKRALPVCKPSDPCPRFPHYLRSDPGACNGATVPSPA